MLTIDSINKLISEFNLKDRLRYVDNEIPNFKGRYDMYNDKTYYGEGDMVASEEYESYIIITISGDSDDLYYFDKELGCITHNYYDNWDWGDGYMLVVDKEYCDRVIIKD